MKKLLFFFVLVFAVAATLAFSVLAADVTVPFEDSNGSASWSISEAYVLTLNISGNYSISSSSSGYYLKSIEPYRPYIKAMVINAGTNLVTLDVDDACYYMGANGYYDICANMPNLVSVNFVGDSFTIRHKGGKFAYAGMFSASSSLKTVWFGDEANKVDGIVDLSGLRYDMSSTSAPIEPFKAPVFIGCSSIEKVILPDGITVLGADLFDGCDALTSVTVSGSSVTSVDASAFPDKEGLTIVAADDTVRNVITTACNFTNTKVSASNPSDTIDGVAGGCTWVLSSGVLTFSGEGALSGEKSWAAYADEISKVVVENEVGAVDSGYFNAFAGKTVTFETYPTCSAATEVRSLQKNNSGITLKYDDTLPRNGHLYQGKSSGADIPDVIGWSFDEASGTLTFAYLEGVTSIHELQFRDDGRFLTWKAIFKDAVYHVVFDGKFSKIKTYCQIKACESPFYDMVNLESVIIKDKSNLVWNHDGSCTTGFFENCSSLRTLGFGDDYEEGVIDLTGVNMQLDNSSKKDRWKKMFKNCTSIEKVNFGVVLEKSSHYSSVATEMFYNCTSLKEITVSSAVSFIGYSAFAGCGSLERVYINSTGFEIENGAFSKNEDLRIYVVTEDDRTKIVNTCTVIEDYNVVILNGTDGGCSWTLAGSVLTFFGSGTLGGEAAWASNVDSVSKVVVESTVGAVESGYFNAFAGKTVTFVTYPTCSAASAVRELQKTNDGIALTYLADVSKTGEQRGGTHNYTWSFDEKTGTLTITASSGTVQLYYANWDGIHKALMAWKDIWRDAIYHIELQGFTNVRNEHTGEWIFSNLPNLVSVKFGTGFNTITEGAGTSNIAGMFEGCSSLTTFGLETHFNEGVIDFTGIKLGAVGTRYPGMFKDCVSVTNVIYDITSGNCNTVVENAFEGCTALCSITLGKNVDAIGANAFGGCSSLRSVTMENVSTAIEVDAFTNCSDVILYCGTFSEAAKIGEKLVSLGIGDDVVTVVASKGGMSVDGFQVRTSGYNGLRVRFKYDETIIENSNGFNFIEYGTLAASALNYYNYSEKLGGLLSYVNGEFVTPLDSIIKIAVRTGKDYNTKANYFADGTTIGFNTVIKNYITKQQVMSDVVIVGYEIWEKNGEKFVIFTKQESEEYNELSLYKVTMGMLEAGAIKLYENESDPVYGTVVMCASSTVETGIDGVTAYVSEHPVLQNKYTVSIVNANDTAADIYDLSFLDPSVSANTFCVIFGENVKDFTAPEIASYWQEHIDDKLAELPDGKSFIFIVDTHWDGNKRNSTDLIRYVRSKTGIKTVVHAGDPFDSFSGDDAKAKAESIFADAMYENFYKVYGDDGLYAIGNHDTNRAGWGTAVNNGAVSGDEWKYFVTNQYIYDLTVANIESKVSFDTALIEKINSGAVTLTAKGGYSAEEMKKEALAWAKMHYTYDDDTQKIRYIILDTGDCGLTARLTFDKDYANILNLEYDWLADVLKDTAKSKADYDVVVIGHMLGLSASGEGKEEYNIHRILSAFKSAGTASFTSDDGNENYLAVIGNVNKSYDFGDCQSFSGTLFTMHGHWHHDVENIYENGVFTAYTDETVLTDASVLDICSIPDATIGGYQTDYDYSGAAGTIKEQSFTVVTITDDGRVVCTRIGLGEDRVFNYN